MHKEEVHAQHDRKKSSSMSVNLLTQQPFPLADKHMPWLRPLQAQPEKSVNKAVSVAGAEP